MKEEDNADAMAIDSEDKTHSAPPTPLHDKGFKKKKRSRSFSLLKAALNIFHDKPSEKEENKKPKKKSNDWKRVVESMRPLTLQDKSPSPSVPSMSPSSSFESLTLDAAVLDSPSVSSVSSLGGMSQYASAPNLQALDTGSDDPEEVFEAVGGDEMIDAKAEEFITQFYKQMKLQERQEF
ncbi:uncharacterized protein LOC116015542 [Ipomoea triloba]|uniref:uncharacterized protein LOC116015542 n=1 Tax=Ipomoea triloba TaxID=35885 RepID=UPI00125D38BB|nr:uncharacterized protein LOC116015542 [Ipomoea triloba]